jgi:hypothetical protein
MYFFDKLEMLVLFGTHIRHTTVVIIQCLLWRVEFMLQMYYFVSVVFVYCMHLSSTLHVLLGTAG